MTALLLALVLVADPVFVFMPDPHVQTIAPVATFQAQTAWVQARVAAGGVQSVLCAGDFDGMVSAAPYWAPVAALDVPVLATIGNHDYASQPNLALRDSGYFDAHFGYQQIAAKRWYGGAFADPLGSHVNQWIHFQVGVRNFLVLSLELWPRAEVMAWASQVVSAHPRHEVIVLTHGYLNFDGTLAASELTFYNIPSTAYTAAMLQAWALGYSNVKLVLGAHEWNDTLTSAHRTDGNLQQVFANYQNHNPASQSVLLLQMGASSVTVQNWNTSTDTLDTTTFPPYSLAYRPIRSVEHQWYGGRIRR